MWWPPSSAICGPDDWVGGFAPQPVGRNSEAYCAVPHTPLAEYAFGYSALRRYSFAWIEHIDRLARIAGTRIATVARQFGNSPPRNTTDDPKGVSDERGRAVAKDTSDISGDLPCPAAQSGRGRCGTDAEMAAAPGRHRGSVRGRRQYRR